MQCGMGIGQAWRRTPGREQPFFSLMFCLHIFVVVIDENHINNAIIFYLIHDITISFLFSVHLAYFVLFLSFLSPIHFACLASLA